MWCEKWFSIIIECREDVSAIYKHELGYALQEMFLPSLRTDGKIIHYWLSYTKIFSHNFHLILV